MFKARKKVVLIFVLSIVALFALPTGVYAILNASSNKKVNQFSGGTIDAAVIEQKKEHEDSSNNVEEYTNLRNKNDRSDKVVTIKNLASGNTATSMFARVRLIPSIVCDKDDSILGGEIKLVYEFKENTAWMVKDNTYYYTQAIAPGEESEALISGVILHQDIPEGYHLELNVVVDSIVSRPTSLLTETWGIDEEFSDLSKIE